ncbi:MAG TPA: DUF4389 domain-containing protein [Gaiellales bacterium]|nr:DUF4389 domain-containing protein [Gaiellales bacterium]
MGAPPDAGGAWVPPVAPVDPYPLQLEVDYPDRQLSRLSTFFRVFAAIPILIVLALMQPDVFDNSRGNGGSAAVAAGILFLPVVVMLLFRRKYPGWWFDWNLELTRFTTRISAYLLLLDDRYPSTDDHQSVHLDLERPDGKALSRWLPLVKWLLAFPHYIVLFALAIGAFFVVIYAWFAILFTGRYPRWAFDYNVGVMRWGLRVEAYALLLATDRYPPFSL